MADDFTSDEDKYANESFENESDNEIPEISTSENESTDLDRDFKRKQEMYPSHTRFKNRNSFSKQYTKYASSTDDDDDDVVISETIAEINTEPMVMDDACTARTFNTRPSPKTLKQFSEEHHTSQKEDDAEEDEDDAVTDEEGEEEEEASEPETEPETEPEIKASQQQNYQHANDGQLYESETENEYERVTGSVSSFKNDNNLEEKKLESIKEEKKPEQEEEEPMDVLTLGDPIDELKQPRIIRYRYVSTNENDYLMHKTPSIEEDFTNYRYANAEEVYSNTEIETEGEGKNPQYEFRVSSQTPTSFNSNDYAFHMNFMHKTASTEKLRMKHVQRKSWSFTNDRMREIERENQILLKKILTQKPTYTLNPQKSKSNTNCNISAPSSCTRLSSAAINRKKQQRQIDLDNQVLKRKIEAISLRRPVL